MSWLISKALMNLHYSQALVEEFSGANCSDGEQSAPLSVTHTHHKFWRNDKTMEFSNLSQFGLTCAVLTESRGEELLTLYLAGFHVRTLAAQEKEQESPESAADYGKNLHGLLAKYDPDTSSWKTAQCSLFEDSELSLEIWPKWGSMLNGAAYRRKIAALRTSESASGLWLTPRESDTGKGEGQETFLARMGDRSDRCAQSLPAQVNNRKTWPTPRCFMHKDSLKDRGKSNLGEVVNEMEGMTVTGQLNPPWVEWLMGWPLGWTDLKPLATGKFQEWQQQHSESLVGNKQ